VLIAAGNFDASGTASVQNIAKWNGTSWSGLDAGVNGPVLCLGIADDKLFVGGEFTTAGGIVANYLAYYSGLQSIPDVISDLVLNVIPNPANDIITIETSQNTKNGELTIYNIKGQEILNRQISKAKTKIDISDFESGVYLVKLITDYKTNIKKLVKE